MAEFDSLAGFAGFLIGSLEAAEHHRHDALEEAAVVVETEAKRVIGTYDYGWPELAQATQQERVRLGFSANDPLLRTGDLRDSIEHTTEHTEAFVGTNAEPAVYQELGTNRIPPRPFLMGAAIHKEEEVRQILGQRFAARLLTRG